MAAPSTCSLICLTADIVLQVFDAVCYLQERMFVSITDLITLCSLLAISPAVREAAALLARGDKREITVLHVSSDFSLLHWYFLSSCVVHIILMLHFLNLIKCHIYPKTTCPEIRNLDVLLVKSLFITLILSVFN